MNRARSTPKEIARCVRHLPRRGEGVEPNSAYGVRGIER